MRNLIMLGISLVLVVALSAAMATADTSVDRTNLRVDALGAKLQLGVRPIEDWRTEWIRPGKELPVAGFRVDEHGVLRDGCGRAGGFWGIDAGRAAQPIR